MTEWDDLWEEKPIHIKALQAIVEHDRYVTRFAHVLNLDWLDRIKVEGDKLQRVSKTRGDYILGVEQKNRTLEQKLEAIQKILKEPTYKGDSFLREKIKEVLGE